MLGRAIGALRKALLIFHAPLDAIVGIENAGEIFKAARHPKSFVSLDGADHLLTRRADAVYVAEVLAAWASRYLPAPAEAEVPGRPEGGEVLVAETGQGRFQQVVRVGRHELRADEPKSFGGDDTGPGPYDYLLAGLGACTSMTVRMYAERKGLPLERVAVRLSHDKIHAQDCEDCETKEGKLDEIARIVELSGALDDSQRQRLLQIATSARCTRRSPAKSRSGPGSRNRDVLARAPKGQLGSVGWSGRAAQGVAGSAATTVVAPRRSSQSPRGVRPIRTTAWSHDGQRRMAPS